MAAEYSIITTQTVQPNQPALFPVASFPCRSGYVFHKEGSGLFRLANRVRSSGCGCGCRPMYETLYNVEFHANVALAEGATVEPVTLAVVVDGEIDPESVMTVTPAAVGDEFNIGTGILVAVPSICGCSSVAIENIGTQPTDITNAVLKIDTAGVRRVIC